MATAQQGTYAAQQGKNWAQPGDPNFGQPGYMGQSDYDAYTKQSGSTGAATGTPPPSGTPTPNPGGMSSGTTSGQGQTSGGPPPPPPLTPAQIAQQLSGGPGATNVAVPGTGTPSTAPPATPPAGPALPASAPPGTPQQPPAGSTDPFASQGGGVYLGNGQWVDKNSPYAAGYTMGPSGPIPTGTGTAGTPSAPGAPAAPGTAPPAAPGTTPGSPGAPGTPGSIPANPADPTGSSSADFMNTLLGLMNPTGTLDQNNPAIAPAIAANNLALQRGAEAARAQQAEVNAQTGTDASGGANTTNQGIAEDMAAKQGQFAGQEVQGLQEQQNQNRLAAIGALGGFLPQEQAQATQWAEHESSLSEQAREADVDAALQKLGIQTQGNLGAQDIALRDKLGSSSAGLTLLGLLMQNQQAGNSMDASTLLGLLNQIQ